MFLREAYLLVDMSRISTAPCEYYSLRRALSPLPVCSPAQAQARSFFTPEVIEALAGTDCRTPRSDRHVGRGGVRHGLVNAGERGIPTTRYVEDIHSTMRILLFAKGYTVANVSGRRAPSEANVRQRQCLVDKDTSAEAVRGQHLSPAATSPTHSMKSSAEGFLR